MYNDCKRMNMNSLSVLIVFSTFIILANEVCSALANKYNSRLDTFHKRNAIEYVNRDIYSKEGISFDWKNNRKRDQTVAKFMYRQQLKNEGTKIWGPVAQSFIDRYFTVPTEDIINCTLFAEDVVKFLEKHENSSVKHIYLIVNGNRNHTKPTYRNYIDISHIQFYKSLETFWLIQDWDMNMYECFNITFEPHNDNNVTLDSFKGLYFNIYIFHFTGFLDFLKMFPHIEVLSIKNSKRLFRTQQAIVDMAHVLKDTPLRVFQMTAFQTVGVGGQKSLTSLLYSWFTAMVKCPIEYLDFSNNEFLVAESSISIFFPKLKFLDISQNNFGLDGQFLYNRLDFWYDWFGMKNIQVINLDWSFADCKQSAKLRKKRGLYTDLSACMVNVSATINDIFSNQLLYCKVLQCMHDLEAQWYPCELIPKFTLTEMRSLIDLECSTYMKIPLPWNLTELYVNNFGVKLNDMFGTKPDGSRYCFNSSNLKILELSGNKQIFHSLGYADFFEMNPIIKGFENLLELDLSGINMNPSMNGKYLSKIEHLYLKSNKVDNKTVQDICTNLPQLKTLDISYNNLKGIGPRIFTNCTELEIIDFSHNELTNTEFEEGLANMLKRNTKLKYVDFSYNKINYLNKDITSNLTQIFLRSKNLEVNVLGNPLMCNCIDHVIDMVEWFLSINISFTNYSLLQCIDQDHGIKLVIHADSHLRLSCIFTKNVQIIMSVSASVIILLLVFLIFKSRHGIRICLFRFKWKFCKNKPKDLEQEDSENSWTYRYDAFLSYCAEDRFLVHSIFRATLEDTYKFRLCVHYRDFPVGNVLAEVIHGHMDTSRSIIIFLSEAYLKKEWCYYELEIAYRKAMQNKAHMIVIKLGSIPQEIIDESNIVNDILTSQIYIELEYPESECDDKGIIIYRPKNMELFWSKLISSIYNDSFCTCLDMLSCSHKNYKALQ